MSFPSSYNAIISRRATKARIKKITRLFAVGWMKLCTPGTGVNLWGESPLYENLIVFIVMDTNKSTSRRQGRLREEGSEGSPVANVRDDEQKPHTRPSPWVSWHNITKPTGSGGRVNAAFVHGKFTSYPGRSARHAIGGS